MTNAGLMASTNHATTAPLMEGFVLTTVGEEQLSTGTFHGTKIINVIIGRRVRGVVLGLVGWCDEAVITDSVFTGSTTG